MFFPIVLVGLIAAVGAVPYHAGMVNTGASAVQRSDDGYGNYQFGYNEDHATGGTFRKEKGGHGYQIGSYGLRDADGRIRIVNYVADAHGFRATVSTNEPGTDVKQDPAATSLTYGHAYAPMPMAPAPMAISHANIIPTYAAAPAMAYGGHIAAEPIYAKALVAPAPAIAYHGGHHVSYTGPAPAIHGKYMPEPLMAAPHHGYGHY